MKIKSRVLSKFMQSMMINEVYKDKLGILLESKDEANIMLAIQLIRNYPEVLMDYKEQIICIFIFIEDRQIQDELYSIIRPLLKDSVKEIIESIYHSKNRRHEIQKFEFIKKLAKNHGLDRGLFLNCYCLMNGFNQQIVIYAIEENIPLYPAIINQVKSLDLSLHPNIEAFDFSVFTNLQSIQLSGGFRKIPNGLDKLVNLEKLHFSNNLIAELPEDFFERLVNLKSFNAENNLLLTLPNSIIHCKNLEYVYLKNNQIEYLPKVFFELRDLREIDLENNYLFSLPEEIGNLHQLEMLNIQNNGIRKLPHSFKKLNKLKELFLFPNPYPLAIPEFLYELPNLYSDSFTNKDKEFTSFRFYDDSLQELDELEMGICFFQENDSNNELSELGINEMVQDEKLLPRDYINGVFLNSIHWEILEDIVDFVDDDPLDALYMQFPSLRKYHRLYTDENMTLLYSLNENFWED